MPTNLHLLHFKNPSVESVILNEMKGIHKTVFDDFNSELIALKSGKDDHISHHLLCPNFLLSCFVALRDLDSWQSDTQESRVFIGSFIST